MAKLLPGLPLHERLSTILAAEVIRPAMLAVDVANLLLKSTLLALFRQVSHVIAQKCVTGRWFRMKVKKSKKKIRTSVAASR